MMGAMLDQSQLVIRDGIAADIAWCLALDSGYQAEYVWQMTVQEEADEILISCRKQRLPRTLDARHDSSQRRLEMAIHQQHCFIVLQVTNSILGYISMRVDETCQIAYLQDIVIDRPWRRQRLGARLAAVAQLWARENSLRQIIFEITTTNYPGILFAQSQGFVFCGFNDRHFPNQEIAVFFSRSI